MNHLQIAVIGTGYVGLVSGACFADFGIDVVCADIDADKIAQLEGGRIPFFEPGLEEKVAINVKAGRLSFTTDVAAAIRDAQVVFIAVGRDRAGVRNGHHHCRGPARQSLSGVASAGLVAGAGWWRLEARRCLKAG